MGLELFKEGELPVIVKGVDGGYYFSPEFAEIMTKVGDRAMDILDGVIVDGIGRGKSYFKNKLLPDADGRYSYDVNVEKLPYNISHTNPRDVFVDTSAGYMFFPGDEGLTSEEYVNKVKKHLDENEAELA